MALLSSTLEEEEEEDEDDEDEDEDEEEVSATTGSDTLACAATGAQGPFVKSSPKSCSCLVFFRRFLALLLPSNSLSEGGPMCTSGRAIVVRLVWCMAC